MFQNQPFIHPLHKIGVFEQFTKFAAKYLCWSLFLIKLQFWGPATLLKKTPAQMLSCEIYKLFKNNYFEEHLWTSASKHYLKRDSNTDAFLWILWITQEHLFLEELQTASSETLVRGSFFNKVASVTAWRLLTVLERDWGTVISLWILRNFWESFFAEHLLATTSHMMLFFSSL